MKRLFLFVLGLVPVLANACYNDRDTLGYELHNKPDVQKALTGRFDRYPALYYTMRVDRLRKQANLTPNEYDDMAVALGRLGRNDDALAALARKAKLANLSPMDQYRLFANRGTIEAHRWIKDGARFSDRTELLAAEKDIAQALALNPNAHFGREGTQLEVIRWLMHTELGGVKPLTDYSLGDWLREHVDDGHWSQGVDIATTLAGLIMLGGAWESPDVALAIAGVSPPSKRGIMELAYERYKELVHQGHKPLDEDLADEQLEMIRGFIVVPSGDTELTTPVRFKKLRSEAEAWHKSKEAYMLERLRRGRHPDTDPTFWNDWHEPPMPVVPMKKPSSGLDWKTQVLPAVAAVAIMLALILKLSRWMHRSR